ncbi:MAG: hypothetical protein BAJATHORv1_30104 [Candidatus Thorarchaeota archaeon]|nr:MAG: hypothetical protein BAJATHORv1_30104 [Candidatus Thorarchaeota archaeon]
MVDCVILGSPYEDDKKILADEDYFSQLMSQLSEMSSILSECECRDSIRSSLLEKQKDLKSTLDNIWTNVESGTYKVDSVAMLRTICTITCKELEKKIEDDTVPTSRVAREVNLMANTMKFVVKPRPSE